ncbi:hypothetical protein GGI24_000872 [Coemansia furcata]|nr:hypothetical protein GGI24_000872 [Coemansia furcata]
MSSNALAKERRAEMLELYDEHHIENDSIRNLIWPADAKLKLLAEAITTKIEKEMEQRLNPAKPKVNPADGVIRTRSKGLIADTSISGISATRTVSSSSRPIQRVSSRAASSKKPPQSGNNDTEHMADIDEIKKWTMTKGDYKGSEKDMYRPVQSFVAYVARRVQSHLSSNKSISVTDKGGCRLVIPCEITDYKPEDSDDNTRIDIGLVDSKYDTYIEPGMKAKYYQLRAIFEVKKLKDDVRNAFAQLYEYTRQMYAEQHDLCFAWGFTMCAGDVRVCHFGPSKAVASQPMDIATRQGRRGFIELLVNMSLCDDSQLGRDPTIRLLPDLGCWQIDCPDDDANNNDGAMLRQYYFTNIICIADHLFGRHTRCFPATAIQPTKQIQEGESIEATVIIKDSFAIAKPQAREDDRDEVRTLKKIRDTFEGNNPHDIIYPKIVVGGRVRFEKGDRIVEDTTVTMYESVDDRLLDMVTGGPLFRTHRRIVLESIGEPLRTAKTVKEFVTVICDAMQCHYEIVDKCKILHRDISDNNILIVRRGDEARGLLIDFDCAIDMSEAKKDARCEMTGTFPFMSLNNLTGSKVMRTSLDDWESMLYLLCWYATIGFGNNDERRLAQKRLEKLPIAGWRYGTVNDIIRAKLNDLRYLGNFEEEIVDEFDKTDVNYMRLGRLAVKLYKALFKNGDLDERYHGTKGGVVNYSDSSDDDDDGMNPFSSGAVLPANMSNLQLTVTNDDSLGIPRPFEMRSKEWEKISKDLLSIINETKRKIVSWKDTQN